MVVKKTQRSTAEQIQCGRWVLRQTKIRQARASQQSTFKTTSTKDIGKKKTRQPPTEVTKEQSCVGENRVAVVKAVYVKNLPKNITQDRLKELFEHHGKITKVVLPSAKVGHEKSRFGFVHFMKRSSAMKALKNTEKYEIDGQVLECSLAKPPADQKSQQPPLLPTYPPADQKSQQPALLPSYPPPWPGYGVVGGAYGALGAGYGALGAGYGGAGFGQPMMYGPPIIYGTTPGMSLMPMLMPMLLPDGRIAYVLQQGPAAPVPLAPPPVPLAPPPPQQSSSTGGSSSGGSSSSDSGRGGSCYNPY